MPFLSFGNIDVEFTKLRKLTLRSYTIVKVLPTTSQVKLIIKKEFT